MLILVTPSTKYKNQYIDMIEEWRATGEELQPWVLQESYSDFNAMVLRFQYLSEGIDVEEGFVPSTTYWAYDNKLDKVIGAVNIRHCLNDFLLRAAGNIGYGVRQSERRKGFATAILKLSIEKCKELGIKKVLLGCYKDNIASVKVILKNGGILENCITEGNTGKVIERYWITIENETEELR